ncbi:MAG: hypothetical protein A4E56_00439 [Pelotomaculum sp. PtaU1.Bin065]|nr:MAG: hypothetical protein A4E56_00439 [Pelotomaculum sp. PtaU1.Bin065]
MYELLLPFIFAVICFVFTLPSLIRRMEIDQLFNNLPELPSDAYEWIRLCFQPLCMGFVLSVFLTALCSYTNYLTILTIPEANAQNSYDLISIIVGWSMAWVVLPGSMMFIGFYSTKSIWLQLYPWKLYLMRVIILISSALFFWTKLQPIINAVSLVN